MNSKCNRVRESLAEKAEVYFDEAIHGLHLYPLESRIPVKAAAYFYREILQSVRNNHFNVFSERAFISEKQKVVILSKIG
ncbi:squalene/phytoene synthase family protein [Evansella cellulosilytica]|uniref:squalene/phytoene synthase family protein n=1 Tax=Evansella cellulosilytica TaxID=1413 RepID=UPI0009D6688F